MASLLWRSGLPGGRRRKNKVCIVPYIALFFRTARPEAAVRAVFPPCFDLAQASPLHGSGVTGYNAGECRQPDNRSEAAASPSR